MQFDHHTVTLLMLRPAPEMDDAAADALQSEHLADLHDQGLLLAAGPLLRPADREFRGLSIWKLEPEAVLHVVTEHPDPSDVAGRFNQLASDPVDGARRRTGLRAHFLPTLGGRRALDRVSHGRSLDSALLRGVEKSGRGPRV